MLKRFFTTTSTIAISAIAFAAALIVSRLCFHAGGLGAPRMPSQASESVAIGYLLAGSVLLAGGLALLARGIEASRPIRWFVLAVFVVLGFAVSMTIESAVFSSAPGTSRMALILLAPCIALAGPLAWPSLGSSAGQDVRGRVARFFRARSGAAWTRRVIGALASFPLIYFGFGLLVAPVVSPYYARGDYGLALPAPALIVQVALLRSLLHLVAALPVIVLWNGSRLRLVVALAAAFFVCVFAYDIVMAIRMPVVLVVVHGVEVLADSLAYAWVLVRLFASDGT